MLSTATPEAIAQAAVELRAGRLVAFPTETVYGLGADATNARAVAAVFAAKGRPRFNPLIVHVASVKAAAALGQLTVPGRKLAAAFWPGPLTLVLPTADGTQAFRAPDHPVALELIRVSGPLFATSANVSDEPDTLGGDEVLIAFATRQDELAAVVDGGAVPGGIASTVVDLSVTPARLVREGPVSSGQLAAHIELGEVLEA
jgi:L-threonylcarbamoyladenylate synthase